MDEPPADAGNAEADTAVTSPQPSPDQTENTVAYNEITMLVLSGSLSRSAAAKLAAGYLEDVGFTVNIQTLGEDDFISTINAGEFDLYYADVCLTPTWISAPCCSPTGVSTTALSPRIPRWRRIWTAPLKTAATATISINMS